MSQITSLYVHKVLSHVSAGVETRDLVQDLGLTPNGPVDPKLMVSADEFYDFFATLAARDPDGLSLPLRIGATMNSDELVKDASRLPIFSGTRVLISN